MLCCCRKKSDKKVQILKRSGPTFGTIQDITTKYNITRNGPEQEVHTKTFDVPSPFKSSVLIDDELEPSQYLHLQFHGIHDSYYIGINEIEFRDADANAIPYTNIQVDGNDVDHETTQPAFPPNGWWAVSGGDHSLVFDFGDVTYVKEIYFWCANSASTPKTLKVSDTNVLPSDEPGTYSAELFFQMAGEPGLNPIDVEFDGGKSCAQIIEFLNNNRAENSFDSFVSNDRKSHFVFYEQGKRTVAYNYYFGRESLEALDLANNTKIETGKDIDKVECRALTLLELRAIRAIIVSKCIDEGWQSTYRKKLRPEDVNLYDLNQLLILPLTKERNCAFKELFASGTTNPTFYVSHWWGESVFDFIRCCEYHAVRYGLAPDEASYWVCAYANRQHDLGTDLGTDPSESSFNKAMSLAKGILLVCDMDVIVTSRIWVDFELYRTIINTGNLDIMIHANGSPHLIAGQSLPNESPYQKNKREQHFPFKHVCAKLMEIKLHQGNSSMPIDKIRILNTMIGNKALDCKAVLERSEKEDFDDPLYRKDLQMFSISDNAIKAEMAQKAISVALSTEGLSCTDFYGLDLFELISNDSLRKKIVLNDIISLDSVTNDVLVSLVSLAANPCIESFEINAMGCRNLTDEVLKRITFTSTLKHLSLNLGYGRNFTNDALIEFVSSKIPTSLYTLDLDLSGFKTPDGNYLPERYSDLLVELSHHIPSSLITFKFVSTLHDEDGGIDGLVQLITALPPGTKTISFTFEQYDNFKSWMITSIIKALPSALEDFSIYLYNGEHIGDNDLHECASYVAKLSNLKDFTLFTRSHGDKGYYETRNFTSVTSILEWV